MRTNRRSGIASIVVLAALALGWFFLAPVQLGGTAIYTATVGDSMEPMFHKGDLAVVKAASSYRVGDVVLYDSPVLHRPVLHRIIAVQQGHYFFKGDHNDFVDPGYATRTELLGTLWYKVPRAGMALSWFGVPAHAALLGGLAAAFLLLGGGSSHGRRRRGTRRHGGRRPVVRRRSWGGLHRPRKSAENILVAVALVLTAVFLFVGFTSSLRKPVAVQGYVQTGTFSYHADVVKPVSAYPTGSAHTGQPLFLSDFDRVTTTFAYRFRSRLPHAVHGTIALKAVVSSDASLRNTYPLEKPRAFSGDRATVGGTFDIQKLRALITQLSIHSGIAGSSYVVELRPVVRISGTVGGKKIRSTFAPMLPFTIDQTVLKLNVSAAAAPPGATYAAPTQAQTLQTAIKPTQPGTIPGFAPNHATFARYHLPISTIRGLGLLFAGIALIALLARFFKPEREIWTHEQRVANRHSCVVVDVVSVGGGQEPGRAPTLISDFESLATLANYCERPILREAGGERALYAVDDDGRLYLYEAAAPGPAPAVTQSGNRPDREPVPGSRRRLTRVVAGLFALAVIATLVTSFTATSTVPLSHAGRSVQPRTVAQLKPSQCAGVAAVTLVIATGSSTSGTSGNDLMLGRNAKQALTLNGNGGTDCLVGGGGIGTTNTFDGSSGSDVCIGPTAAVNIFKNCETHYP